MPVLLVPDSRAAMAVATGVADVVVCWRAFNERSGMRFGGAAMQGATMLPPFLDMYGPYGLLTPASWMALQARRRPWLQARVQPSPSGVA